MPRKSIKTFSPSKSKNECVLFQRRPEKASNKKKRTQWKLDCEIRNDRNQTRQHWILINVRQRGHKRGILVRMRFECGLTFPGQGPLARSEEGDCPGGVAGVNLFARPAEIRLRSRNMEYRHIDAYLRKLPGVASHQILKNLVDFDRSLSKILV